MNWQTDIEIERKAEKLKGKNIEAQKKLIYEWVKKDLISFPVFVSLLSLIGENCNEKSNTQRTE